MGSNKFEHTAEEEYLDDPITLVQDVAAVVYATKEADAEASQNYVTNDEVGSNMKNCVEPKATSTLEESSAYGTKNTYMPPLTFFENSRNVRLVNRCRPMSIQIIDCVQYPGWIKTQKHSLSNRKPPYKSSLSLERKSCIASIRGDDFETIKDCNRIIDTPSEKVLSTDKAAALEIINDSVLKKNVENNNMGLQSVIHVQENSKKEIYYKYASPEPKHKGLSGIAKSSEGKFFSKIDYKRNKGLIGIKINRISVQDINPYSKERTPNNKSNVTKTDRTDQGRNENIVVDARVTAQKEHSTKIVKPESKINGIDDLKLSNNTNRSLHKVNESNKEKNENSMVCKLKVHPDLIRTSLMDKFNLESSEQNGKNTKESDEYRIDIDRAKKNVNILQVFYPRKNEVKSKVLKHKTDNKKKVKEKNISTSKNRRTKNKESSSLKSDKKHLALRPESKKRPLKSKRDLQDTNNLSYVGKTVLPFQRSYPPGLSNIDVDSTITGNTINNLLQMNRDQPSDYDSHYNDQNSHHSFGEYMSLLNDQTDKIPSHDEIIRQSHNNFVTVNKEPNKNNVIQPYRDKTSILHKNGATKNEIQITSDNTKQPNQYDNKASASNIMTITVAKTGIQKVPENKCDNNSAINSKQCELKVQTVTQINNKIEKAIIDQSQRNVATVMEAPKDSNPVQSVKIKNEVKDDHYGSNTKSSDLVTPIQSTTNKYQTNNSKSLTQHTKSVTKVYNNVSSLTPERSELQVNNILSSIDNQLPPNQNSNVVAPNTQVNLQRNNTLCNIGRQIPPKQNINGVAPTIANTIFNSQENNMLCNISRQIPPKQNINGVAPTITNTSFNLQGNNTLCNIGRQIPPKQNINGGAPTIAKTSFTPCNSYLYSSNESQNSTNPLPSFLNHQNIIPQSESQERLLTPQNCPIQYMQSRTNSAQTAFNAGFPLWQQPFPGNIHNHVYKQIPPPYNSNFINTTGMIPTGKNITENTYNFDNFNNYYPYITHNTFLAPPPQPPPPPPPQPPPPSTPLVGAQRIINVRQFKGDKNTLKRYCLKAYPINSSGKTADQGLNHVISNPSQILSTLNPTHPAAGTAALLRNVIPGKIIAVRKPSTNTKKGDRCGKLNLIETKNTKTVASGNTKLISETITPGGYSPPILPIPSVKKSLELLSLINSKNTIQTKNKTVETVASESSPKSKTLNDTLEQIKKRKNVEVDHSNTKPNHHPVLCCQHNRKDFKKISLEEYKKRSGEKFHNDKFIDLTGDDTHENKVKSWEINSHTHENKTDRRNVKRHSLDSQDLGYDSDTTVKL